MRILTIIIAFLFFGHSIAQSTDRSAADIDRICKTIRDSHSNYDSLMNVISNQSPENGVLKGYYDKNELKLLSVTFKGETGKRKTDYYFVNGNLCFVEDIYYAYKRPIYRNESKSNENNDSLAFDTDKTEINEHDKLYFLAGKLIHWTSNGASVDKKLAAYKGAEISIPKKAELASQHL